MKRHRGIAVVTAIAAAALACNALLGNEDGVFERADAALETGGNDASTAEDGEPRDSSTLRDVAIENGGCDARPDDDPKNCGVCGHDCLGGECRSGKCQPVVMSEDAGAGALQRMVISDEGIYLTGGNTLHRLGLDGGAATTQYAPPSGRFLGDVAASPTKVFVAEGLGGTPSIRSCPFGAAPCLDAAVESTAIADPRALSVVGERAFWSDVNGMYAASPGGGAPELFQSEGVTSTAASGTRIYWGRSANVGIRSALADGGDVVTLVPDAGTVLSRIAVTSGLLLWVKDATIYIAEADGGLPRSLVATSGTVVRLAVAGDQVYWLESAGGVLRRCAVFGTCAGEPVSLKRTADFAITQRAIWWVEEEGRLLRLAR